MRCSWGFFGLHQSKKNNPKHPKAATFYLALFKMAKLILKQSKFIYVTTLQNKSILPIPRKWNLEPQGSSAESRSNQIYPECHLSSYVFSHPFQETLSNISGFPEAPFNAQKQLKAMFSLPWFGWLMSCCYSLNSNLIQTSLIPRDP